MRIGEIVAMILLLGLAMVFGFVQRPTAIDKRLAEIRDELKRINGRTEQ
jgi:F0F1-type ATP synthase membrane subunit b/b'